MAVKLMCTNVQISFIRTIVVSKVSHDNIYNSPFQIAIISWIQNKDIIRFIMELSTWQILLTIAKIFKL